MSNKNNDFKAPSHAIVQTPAAPEVVPVVSREACLTQLAYNPPLAVTLEPIGGVKPLQERKPVVVPVLPGLNYLSRTDVERCGVDFDKTEGRLQIADPTTMPEFQAIEIAKITSSRKALQAWSKNEKRVKVLTAIEARLASGKAK